MRPCCEGLVLLLLRLVGVTTAGCGEKGGGGGGGVLLLLLLGLVLLLLRLVGVVATARYPTKNDTLESPAVRYIP